MPRGVRAVHGAAVDGSIHSHSTKPHGVICVPIDEWLVAQCWCKTEFVCVPFYEVRHLGITRSCGSRYCKSPDGEQVVGTLATREAILPKEVRGTPTGYPHKVVWWKREKIAHLSSEERRDMVQALWRQRKTAHLIADYLNLPEYVIRDDLLYLFKNNRLS